MVAEPASRIGFCECAGWPSLGYFLSVPAVVDEYTPLLVLVHGAFRDAREHAEAFATLCSDIGWMLVAPLFPEPGFARYEQFGLGAGDPAGRSDLALDAILAQVAAETGAPTDRFYLFGCAGGGQFAHRYAMVHPGRVRAVAMGSVDSFTFPDPEVPFPDGLRLEDAPDGLEISPEAALSVPMAAIVGCQDGAFDPVQGGEPEIVRRQGRTRPERARRWVDAMQTAAAERGLDTCYRYFELRGCGGSFAECVVKGRIDRHALEFFLDMTVSWSRARSGDPHARRNHVRF